MNNNEFKNLKVGDKVFVYYTGHTAIKVVEKITPTGLIKVDGILFNTNGRVRGGDTYCRTYIEIATPEKIEEFKQRIYIKKVMNNLKNLKIEDVTFEQAEEINKIFKFNE